MLTIRKEQMQALQEAHSAALEDEVVRHVARTFQPQYLKLTNEGKDEAPFRHLIRNAIRRAIGYRITAEPDVRLFVELTVSIAPEFEFLKEWDWAKAILEDDAISGGAKMALINASRKG